MASPGSRHAPNVHQHLQQQLLSILRLLEEYHSFLMASSDTKQTSRWSDAETASLVNYLHAKLGERADGNFRAPAFNGAVTHLRENHPNETPKNISSVRSKFAQVCLQYLMFYSDRYTMTYLLSYS